MNKKVILTILFLQVAFMCFSQNPDFGNNKSAGKYYSVNGINLYCEIYGKGEPLLLIHGNGGSINAFKKNIPFLSQKFMVIAVDSRAQGKSTDNSASISFEQMASDFNVLLDTLKISSARVVGWSDGGITALIMAMNYPKKIKSIAVTGANIFADATAFRDGFYKECMQEYDKNKDKKIDDPVKKNDWKLFLLDLFQPKLKFEDLQIISCPVLVIAGDNDLININHTVKIFQSIKNANLWIVPNCGHGTLIEKSDEFNSTVSNFFAGNK